MSLMNGVDSEEIIALPRAGITCFTRSSRWSSHKEADGFHFDPDTTVGIISGEKEPPFESPRVRPWRPCLGAQASFPRHRPHPGRDVEQIRLNVCNNLPQAILGAGVGCYRDSVHMKAISDGLRQKLIAIAAAKGIDLCIGGCRVRQGQSVPPDARYSTLQDLDADAIPRSTCSPGR